MAKRSRNAERVFQAVAPIVQEEGLELIDVAFVKEGKYMFLRVFVDKRGGVTIDDCQRVSERLDPIIDDKLEIHSHDFFEVSSPGLDRPLKTHADFVRYAGEWAEVRLYRAQDGQKQFEGVLSSGAEDEVVLCTEDDQELRFALDDVALVKRLVRF